MSRLIASALLIDGILGALWVARFVPLLGAYDGRATLLILVRGLVAALLTVSSSMLFRAMPPGPLFARAAVLTSAILFTVEIGFRLSPSSLFPTYRWPVVIAYWVYAGAVAIWLRPRATPLERNESAAHRL